MDDDNIWIPIVALVILLILLSAYMAYHVGLKNGAIQQASGKVKYELREQSNHEMRWQRVEEYSENTSQ